MRVTNSMMVRDMLWNANKNLVSMSERQRELSTGKRIHKPSDDPVGTTLLLKYKTDIAEAEQYKKNIQDGLGWMEVTESSLMSVKELLQRIRELTVRGANGTNTVDDVKKIKSEVDQLTEELLVLGNSTNAGRYIFSGLQTDEKLFNKDGTYNVLMTSSRVQNKPVPAYEVAIGEVLNMGTHPIDVFGITQNLSFFNGKLDAQTKDTNAGTSTLKTFDLGLMNGSPLPQNQPVEITVNGDTYALTAAQLSDVPMTTQKFLKALNGASAVAPATGVLSDVARLSVSYETPDPDDESTWKMHLTVSPIATGPIVVGDFTVNAVPKPVIQDVAGVPSSSVVLQTAVLNDADVAASTREETLVITLDGKQYGLTVDMSLYNTVDDLRTGIQTQINTLIGPNLPAGSSLVVTGTNGTALDFTFSGATDGKPHKIDLDYVVSNQSQMISDLYALSAGFSTQDNAAIQQGLTNLDTHLNQVLTTLGEIGGKTNRIDYIMARVEENKISFTGLLSKVQDVDMAEAIMLFKNLENIYRASLSVGSKVIQPSLVDFIR